MSAWSPLEQDVQSLIAALDVIDTTRTEAAPEFQYTSPVLVCVEAVLSINRRYDDFVRPRMEYIESEWSQVTSLSDLLALIDSLGVDGFEQFWNYRHAERVGILKHLAEFFVQYRLEGGYSDDMGAMRAWASQVSFSDHKRFPVYGIGPATFQYLRMVLGVSTVKPDVHILGFVNDALGRRVSHAQAIDLLEVVAERLGLTAQALDYAIWESRARGTRPRTHLHPA